MAKVEFAFVAGCLTLLTACGDPIPPGALASPLPTKTPVPVAPVVPTRDDPYKIERIDTPEAAMVKLRKTIPYFLDDEKRSVAPALARAGRLKDYVPDGVTLGGEDVNQLVWYVEVQVPKWTERRGPEGFQRDFEYNAWIYLLSAQTGKFLMAQKRLI